jgi:FAD/FMN-containing dehydrogenase
MPGLLTQIGHGTILFHVYDVSKTADQKKFEEIVSDVRRLVRQRRGTAVVEQAPKFIKENFGVWDGFEQNEETFRILKSNFDPLNILNPGRLFQSAYHE